MQKQQSSSSQETSASFEQPFRVEMEYRLTDFMPLFAKRLFRKTLYWLTGTVLATASGVSAIYAISLATSGQTERLGELSIWLLTAPILFVAFAAASVFAVFSNARVLQRFYRQSGSRSVAVLDKDGMEVGTAKGAVSLRWEQATRFDVGRSGLVVWKGDSLPLVLPARAMGDGRYDKMLALVSRSLEEIRMAQAGTQAAPDGEPEVAGMSAETVDGVLPAGTSVIRTQDPDDGVATAPDYTDSEYRFGDEWVPGGVRFRIHIGPRDRDALKAYALTRPGSRWGMLAFSLVAVGMAVWLFYTGLSNDRSLITPNVLLGSISSLLAFVFLTAVFRPSLFLWIVRRFPGNKQRQDGASREVLCVLSDGILYAKTEGRVDRAPISTLHDKVRYRDWLFLFKDRKTAYIIPLREIDAGVLTEIGEALDMPLQGE
ncbi:MAG: hypothetical protein GX153_11125 [Clostridiaceae bacterium]|jgi:hypothetical protein|nr:hypothetical protein [Clostridiaceae bacterium]